jgi:hypothetical protein
MHSDVGEQNNLYDEQPAIVAELLEYLRSDVARGRSTVGSEAANDVNHIEIWKNRVVVNPNKNSLPAKGTKKKRKPKGRQGDDTP